MPVLIPISLSVKAHSSELCFPVKKKKVAKIVPKRIRKPNGAITIEKVKISSLSYNVKK